jgi:hypothetical protein
LTPWQKKRKKDLEFLCDLPEKRLKEILKKKLSVSLSLLK